MVHDKKLFWKSAVTVILLIGVAFFVGIHIGYAHRPSIEKIESLIHKEPTVVFDSQKTDFEPFWKAWNLINEKFAAPNGTTTDQEKVWGAIEGLASALGDPYSVFMPPADAGIFEENIAGNFGGLGMEIGIKEGIITVIAPLKNSPALEAHVMSGDHILEIDGTKTAGMTVDKAVSLIRGKIGTTVMLTIERKGQSEFIKKKLVRAVINIPTIDTKKRDDGIFVIKLYNFSATSPSLFRDALREFVTSNQNKLILDVRGNPGGFLDAAVEIASWFLPVGKVVTTEDYGGRDENVVYRSHGYNIFNQNLKVVMLVDKGSASASEILAGALSEHGVARLVGEKTFGKGSVQELLKITPDTSLKLTVALWKTPKGRSISKEGIKPEFEVPMTDKDREAGRDPQLDKAVQVLLAE